MLQSGKYELVYEYFGKMKRSGEAIKALTYKGTFVLCFTVKDSMIAKWFLKHGFPLILVLVKTFWEDGKVNEAVRVVRDMEQRGLVGAACVYYELACCLCNNGRWLEAMVEVGSFIYSVTEMVQIIIILRIVLFRLSGKTFSST